MDGELALFVVVQMITNAQTSQKVTSWSKLIHRERNSRGVNMDAIYAKVSLYVLNARMESTLLVTNVFHAQQVATSVMKENTNAQNVLNMSWR